MAISRGKSASNNGRGSIASKPRQYDNFGYNGYSSSYGPTPFVAPYQAISSYGPNQPQPVVIIQPVVKAHKAKGWLKGIKKGLEKGTYIQRPYIRPTYGPPIGQSYGSTGAYSTGSYGGGGGYGNYKSGGGSSSYGQSSGKKHPS